MIKFRARSVVLSAAVLSAAPFVHASQLLYDGFSYSAAATLQGQIDTQETPNKTWALTGGSGSGTKIGAAGLSYTGTTDATGNPSLPPSVGLSDQTDNTKAGADRIALESTVPDPTVATGTEHIYYSLLLQANGTSFVTTGGSFMAGINNVTGANGTALSNAGGVLCIKSTSTTAGNQTFNLGVGQNQSTTGGTARVFDTSNAYSLGDTLFVVVDYILNPGSQNDAAKLYVFKNPATIASVEPGTANATSDATAILTIPDVSTAGNGFQSFFTRNNGSEPTSINLDEIRVGTTWGDVVPTPEPTAIALLGLAVPLASRRRRRA